MGKVLSGNLAITEGTNAPTLANRIFGNLKSVTKRENFTNIVTDGNIYYENGNYIENGIMSRVYYYAGNVENNWVKFGTDTSGNELWWRIIRSNEDGGIRLLYAGTMPNSKDAYIGTSNYSKENNSPKLVGYMYGNIKDGEIENLETDRKNEINSNIKIVVDNWYEENLLNDYDKYINKTAIYCNDRAIRTQYNTGIRFDFAASYRIEWEHRPSYKCGINTHNGGSVLYDTASVNDKFTASNNSNVGNQQLEYPVALMTADEITYAGALWLTENKEIYCYLNSENESVTGDMSWWTMSPKYNTPKTIPLIHRFDAKTSSIKDGEARNELGVRPVISLKSCLEISGDGTVDTPYEVLEISNECALSDN